MELTYLVQTKFLQFQKRNSLPAAPIDMTPIDMTPIDMTPMLT